MAKITLSESAPADANFSLANVVFTAPFETTDPAVIANARVHPWLKVEAKAGDSKAVFLDVQIEEAVSIANDPVAVKAELDRRLAELPPYPESTSPAADIEAKPKARAITKDKE